MVYKNNTRREMQALQCALPVRVVLTSRSKIKGGNMSYNQFFIFLTLKKRKRIKHLVAAESGLWHPACQIHTKDRVSEKPGSSVHAVERPAEVIKLG